MNPEVVKVIVTIVFLVLILVLFTLILFNVSKILESLDDAKQIDRLDNLLLLRDKLVDENQLIIRLAIERLASSGCLSKTLEEVEEFARLVDDFYLTRRSWWDLSPDGKEMSIKKYADIISSQAHKMIELRNKLVKFENSI